LVDGELGPAASAAACAAWRRSDSVRRDWHEWHLIGDVLRSDDLASDAARDARFLAAVRERLADEPVVLAPAPALPAAATSMRRGRWMLPSAVAAGFVLVVGAFSVLQQPAAPGLATLAGSDRVPVAAPEPRAATAAVAAEPQTAVVADAHLIRDARLDRYLAAHKQFAGTSALGVPSAFLRSATVDSAASR
jgi:sigma-E factor negative regulatory protein RseA